MYMRKHKNGKRAALLFTGIFVIILACMIFSVVRTNAYNSQRHNKIFKVSELFSDGSKHKDDNGVFVNATARDSTWTKVFDLNKRRNYQRARG